MYIGLHLQYPFFLSDFNENWAFREIFYKSTEISNFINLCVQLEASCARRVGGGGGGGGGAPPPGPARHDKVNSRFDTNIFCALIMCVKLYKFTVAFPNFVKAPKMGNKIPDFEIFVSVRAQPSHAVSTPMLVMHNFLQEATVICALKWKWDFRTILPELLVWLFTGESTNLTGGLNVADWTLIILGQSTYVRVFMFCFFVIFRCGPRPTRLNQMSKRLFCQYYWMCLRF
jgi:hypothetical protein